MFIDDLLQDNEALQEQNLKLAEEVADYGNSVIGLTKLCEKLMSILQKIPNEHIADAKDKVALDEGTAMLRGLDETREVPGDD